MILTRLLSAHRAWRTSAGLAALPLLAGCDLVVMNPAGDVARQQSQIVLISTGLMLLVIIPVMVLTVVFAWRYRASNKAATYDPEFDHSTALELVIWSGPLLIIIALGALTWISTHLLDPYRPLGRVKTGQALERGHDALEIQVVSMDWKWLFIYPEQGVATVNQLVLPVDRPVRFRLTSTSVMNTFYVPTLAGMIYTMPGMETKLNAVLNKPGRYEGFSANYSGAGFSDMRFTVDGVDGAGFANWVRGLRGANRALDTRAYLVLERPSEKVPAIPFATVEQGLFDRAVNMCVRPGTPCMTDSMRAHAGAHGGGTNNRLPTPGQKTEGALQKGPDEMGESPHLSAPHGEPRGRDAPGDDSNRNMTWTPPVRVPGTATAAQG